MTFRRYLSAFSCVALVACGSSAATNGTTGPTGATGAPGAPGAGGATAATGQGPDVCVGVGTGTAACEAPLDVATADALLDAMIAAKPFDQGVVGAAPASIQQPSRDVRVTATLAVDVDAFRAKAPRCPAATDAGAGAGAGCSETLFAQEKTFQVIRTIYGSLGDAFAPGVTCLEEEAGVAGPSGCRRVSIAAGSVVRFQMVREQNRFAGSTKAYLRIVRPCTDPCADGETRCGASNLCVKSGADFCILCEGKSELACACRAGCQVANDGTECGASTSEDTVVGGTCHAGSCTQ